MIYSLKPCNERKTREKNKLIAIKVDQISILNVLKTKMLLTDKAAKVRAGFSAPLSAKAIPPPVSKVLILVNSAKVCWM